MSSDKPIFWGAGIAVVVIAALLYYYYFRPTTHVAAPPVPAHAPAVPAPNSAPGVRHPVPQVAPGQEAKPLLPPLSGSDLAIEDALSAVIGRPAVMRFLVPQHVIRDIVVTIDNLPRKKVAVDLRPIKPIPGRATVIGDIAKGSGVVTLNPDSYSRYAPFVHLVQSTDAKQLAQLYFRFYPLFQEAYENLGYPDRYFNDRVIQVIDNLLATPEVKQPIKLVQPNVMYQYADPQLEALSAGQKALIRMGSTNEAVIKAKLRELRPLLAGQKEGDQDSGATADSDADANAAAAAGGGT